MPEHRQPETFSDAEDNDDGDINNEQSHNQESNESDDGKDNNINYEKDLNNNKCENDEHDDQILQIHETVNNNERAYDGFAGSTCYDKIKERFFI